jgi:uncharacterized membrane protein YkvA (DUF1232 family)
MTGFTTPRPGSVDDVSGETWVWIAVAVLVIGGITLVAAIWFARRLIVTRRALGELGFNEKFAFYGALAYMIFPVDVLPDPIFLDDVGVLAAALFYLTKSLQERKGLKAPDRLHVER